MSHSLLTIQDFPVHLVVLVFPVVLVAAPASATLWWSTARIPRFPCAHKAWPSCGTDSVCCMWRDRRRLTTRIWVQNTPRIVDHWRPISRFWSLLGFLCIQVNPDPASPASVPSPSSTARPTTSATTPVAMTNPTGSPPPLPFPWCLWPMTKSDPTSAGTFSTDIIFSYLLRPVQWIRVTDELRFNQSKCLPTYLNQFKKGTTKTFTKPFHPEIWKMNFLLCSRLIQVFCLWGSISRCCRPQSGHQHSHLSTRMEEPLDRILLLDGRTEQIENRHF